MTDIEQKALALVKAVGAERQRSFYTRTINRRVDTDEALCRAIEQHEAFRQEVSDVVWDYYGGKHIPRTSMFAKFAIPKPDPLLAALLELELSSDPEEGQHDAKWLRIKLDKLGFEIKEKSK